MVPIFFPPLIFFPFFFFFQELNGRNERRLVMHSVMPAPYCRRIVYRWVRLVPWIHPPNHYVRSVPAFPWPIHVGQLWIKCRHTFPLAIRWPVDSQPALLARIVIHMDRHMLRPRHRIVTPPAVQLIVAHGNNSNNNNSLIFLLKQTNKQIFTVARHQIRQKVHQQPFHPVHQRPVPVGFVLPPLIHRSGAVPPLLRYEEKHWNIL